MAMVVITVPMTMTWRAAASNITKAVQTRLCPDRSSVVQAPCMAATSTCALLPRTGHWRGRSTGRLPAWLWTPQPMLAQSTITSCVIHTTRYVHAGADLRVGFEHSKPRLLLGRKAPFVASNGVIFPFLCFFVLGVVP